MNTIVKLAIVSSVFTCQVLVSVSRGTSHLDDESCGVVTAAELLNKIENREEFVLMDCRPPEEYELGHIPGAVNVSFDTFTFQENTVLKQSIQDVEAEVGKKIDLILVDGTTEEAYMSISKIREFSSNLPDDRDAVLVFYCRRPD